MDRANLCSPSQTQRALNCGVGCNGSKVEEGCGLQNLVEGDSLLGLVDANVEFADGLIQYADSLWSGYVGDVGGARGDWSSP